MTENQSNALVKSPNTKKAIAVLQKFAKMEAEYKAMEKESKAASELIKEAMIEQGIDKVTIDTDGLTGFITLAERVSYRATDFENVSEEFLKQAVDSTAVKAHVTLKGDIPAGVEETRTQYIVKKFKVTE